MARTKLYPPLKVPSEDGWYSKPGTSVLRRLHSRRTPRQFYESSIEVSPAAVSEFQTALFKKIASGNGNNSSTSSSSFTLFKKLLPEIRLMIWELLLPEARIVDVLEHSMRHSRPPWESSSTPPRQIPRLDSPHTEEVFEPRKMIYTSTKCDYILWILAQTCHESREVVRSSGYECVFGTTTAPASVWFNFKIDTLYIHAKSVFNPFERNLFMVKSALLDLQRVKRLVFDTAEEPAHEDLLLLIMLQFPALDELFLTEGDKVGVRSQLASCLYNPLYEKNEIIEAFAPSNIHMAWDESGKTQWFLRREVREHVAREAFVEIFMNFLHDESKVQINAGEPGFNVPRIRYGMIMDKREAKVLGEWRDDFKRV
jgi:hypothetical protein